MDNPNERTPRKSLTKKQLEDPMALDLLALLQTMTFDGKILEPEIALLNQWLDDHKTSSIPGIAYLRESVQTVLADGRVTDQERAWLQKAVETVLPKEEREIGRCDGERPLQTSAGQLRPRRNGKLMSADAPVQSSGSTLWWLACTTRDAPKSSAGMSEKKTGCFWFGSRTINTAAMPSPFG
jgi:hypothetical protein